MTTHMAGMRLALISVLTRMRSWRQQESVSDSGASAASGAPSALSVPSSAPIRSWLSASQISFDSEALSEAGSGDAEAALLALVVAVQVRGGGSGGAERRRSDAAAVMSPVPLR